MNFTHQSKSTKNFTYENTLAVGSNTIWDGKTDNGQAVSDGTYFYKAIFTLDNSVADCKKQMCEFVEQGFVVVR
ncbi:MAG TPA: hypothetical protein PLP27_02220 [Crocinitomicaceae bacterium]|nr:hypothetical protein [Crocinitomicaceae bacterium]